MKGSARNLNVAARNFLSRSGAGIGVPAVAKYRSVRLIRLLKVRARLRPREHSVNHGTVRAFRDSLYRATNPLDSCNENLPKEHIHRKYASRPAGMTAPGFLLPDDIDPMQTFGCRKRKVIVLGLLFTMKIPTTTCGVTAAPRSVTRSPACAGHAPGRGA